MLQPVIRRTWAPQGQTPLLRQWDRRDRLSTIAALTVEPRRRRYGLYWASYAHNIRGEQVRQFLQRLHRHLPQGFTLIWDRGQPHRAATVKAWLAKHRRVVMEWLPAYAPDLNPVEPVWSHTKHDDLANFTPHDLDQLEQGLQASMTHTKGCRRLLAGFFGAARLKL